MVRRNLTAALAGAAVSRSGHGRGGPVQPVRRGRRPRRAVFDNHNQRGDGIYH